jgi:hypothetical protein
LKVVLPWLLLLALLVHLGAHVVLVVRIARTGGRAGILRAGLAFIVSPLAPLWGWAAGMRRTTMVWCIALASYAVGVAIA